ncbi:hypothetical protein SAMN05192559_101985 [Halobacillus karajensis]|uniref:Uncharacterized protein n=1 Tax=Halobacillus karajensis TaxID=195088 RepID=A0A059NZC9_9BACI|nr:hypothetical protein [Halobacillus karajensis]CDQ18401.1 hypothetical protein BN982_00671 [Halobacillus karajensis]CDQ23527.1 hypothetical protein BN983_01757 [Halobacillus karajensis]CDQ27009.1 hypothetical protein BN981_01237 [Halobacillus karajensis]SEH51906.1 hypothetical protein SAMN05192559_101985 [Halobacillus karajensis]
MIYAYLSPLLLIALVFVSTIFVIDWLAKMLIYIFLVNMILLPIYLLYKEEVNETKLAPPPSSQEGNEYVPKNTDS